MVWPFNFLTSCAITALNLCLNPDRILRSEQPILNGKARRYMSIHLTQHESRKRSEKLLAVLRATQLQITVLGCGTWTLPTESPQAYFEYSSPLQNPVERPSFNFANPFARAAASGKTAKQPWCHRFTICTLVWELLPVALASLGWVQGASGVYFQADQNIQRLLLLTLTISV